MADRRRGELKCPHCGQAFIPPLPRDESTLLTLRYMVREGKPLFWGCLALDNQDPQLEEMERSGWIKRTPKGFVVTEAGRREIARGD